jgi:hypothetical protein
MPAGVDEAVWKRAKRAAAKQGKGDNYALIMHIYKKMKGITGKGLKKSSPRLVLRKAWPSTGGRGAQVGEVHDWHGQKFRKLASGKWEPVTGGKAPAKAKPEASPRKGKAEPGTFEHHKKQAVDHLRQAKADPEASHEHLKAALAHTGAAQSAQKVSDHEENVQRAQKATEAAATAGKPETQKEPEQATEEAPQSLDAIMAAAIEKYGQEAVAKAAETAAKKAAQKIDATLQSKAKALAASNPAIKKAGEAAAKGLTKNSGAAEISKAVDKAAKDPGLRKAAESELGKMQDQVADAATGAIVEGSQDVKKPSKFRAVLKTILKGGAGSFVFGFLDNFIMYCAGASIDKHIMSLGLGAAATAGVGNAISDAVGQAASNKVEGLLEKVGLGEEQTSGALSEKTEGIIKNIASVGGVFVGALAGMVPMLFGVSFGKSEEDDWFKAKSQLGLFGGEEKINPEKAPKPKPKKHQLGLDFGDHHVGGSKPPGTGWEPIPDSKEGGWRRRTATAGTYGKWEYWYPKGHKQPSLLGKSFGPAPTLLIKAKQLSLFGAPPAKAAAPKAAAPKAGKMPPGGGWRRTKGGWARGHGATYEWRPDDWEQQKQKQSKPQRAKTEKKEVAEDARKIAASRLDDPGVLDATGERPEEDRPHHEKGRRAAGSERGKAEQVEKVAYEAPPAAANFAPDPRPVPDDSIAADDSPAITLHPQYLPKLEDRHRLPPGVRRFPHPYEHIQQLFSHQVEGAERIRRAWEYGDGCLLQDDAGLGKTNTAMAAMVAHGGKRNLIVVPTAGKEGLKTQWMGPTASGLYGIDIKGAEVVTNRKGNEKVVKRLDQLSSTEPGWYIVSYDELWVTEKKEDGTKVKKLRPEIFDGQWDAVAFDEAHTMVKPETQATNAGKELMARAGKVLYMSATPFTNVKDMQYLTKLGLWDEYYGKTYKDVDLAETGPPPSDWKARKRRAEKAEKRITTDEEAFAAWAKVAGARVKDATYAAVKNPTSPVPMTAIAAVLHAQGKSIKRETSLDGVSTKFGMYDQGRLTPEESGAFLTAKQICETAVTDGKIDPMLTEALYKGWARQYWEIIKVPEAIAIGKQALAEGKQVAFFTSFKNAEHAHLQAFPKMLERRADKLFAAGNPKAEALAEHYSRVAEVLWEAVSELPPASSAVSRLVAEFGGSDSVAEIHGNTTKKPHVEQAKYQKGVHRVVVATMAKGGTGISLHDTTGKAPRVQINLSLPWSGRELTQVAGRSHRLGSQSDTDMHWLVGEDETEKHNAAVVAKRLRSMGSLTSGDPDVKVEAGALASFDFAANTVDSDSAEDLVSAIQDMQEAKDDENPSLVAESEEATAARDWFHKIAAMMQASMEGRDILKERYAESKKRKVQEQFREARRAAHQMRQAHGWNVHWRSAIGKYEILMGHGSRVSPKSWDKDFRSRKVGGQGETYGKKSTISYMVPPEGMAELAKRIGAHREKVNLAETPKEHLDPSKRSDYEKLADTLRQNNLRIVEIPGNDNAVLIHGATYDRRTNGPIAAVRGFRGGYDDRIPEGRDYAYEVPKDRLPVIVERLGGELTPGQQQQLQQQKEQVKQARAETQQQVQSKLGVRPLKIQGTSRKQEAFANSVRDRALAILMNSDHPDAQKLAQQIARRTSARWILDQRFNLGFAGTFDYGGVYIPNARNLAKSIGEIWIDALIKAEQLSLFGRPRAAAEKPEKKEAPKAPAHKASAATPPGRGWQPIPHGTKGGFRRKASDGSWEYWYATSAHHDKPKTKAATLRRSGTGWMALDGARIIARGETLEDVKAKALKAGYHCAAEPERPKMVIKPEAAPVTTEDLEVRQSGGKWLALRGASIVGRGATREEALTAATPKPKPEPKPKWALGDRVVVGGVPHQVFGVGERDDLGILRYKLKNEQTGKMLWHNEGDWGRAEAKQTKVTKKMIADYTAAGAAAFRAGKSAAIPQNMLVPGSIGTNDPLISAYQKGWNLENAAAPVADEIREAKPKLTVKASAEAPARETATDAPKPLKWGKAEPVRVGKSRLPIEGEYTYSSADGRFVIRKYAGVGYSLTDSVSGKTERFDSLSEAKHVAELAHKATKLTIKAAAKPAVIPYADMDTAKTPHPSDTTDVIAARKAAAKAIARYERIAAERDALQADHSASSRAQRYKKNEQAGEARLRVGYAVKALNRAIVIANAEPGWDRMPESAGKVEKQGAGWARLGEHTTRAQAIRRATAAAKTSERGDAHEAPAIALDHEGRWWVGQRGDLEDRSVGGMPLRVVAAKDKGKWDNASIAWRGGDPREDEINARQFFESVKTGGAHAGHYPGGKMADEMLSTRPPVDPEELPAWQEAKSRHERKVAEEKRKADEKRQRMEAEAEARRAKGKAEAAKREAERKAKEEAERKATHEAGAPAREFWSGLKPGDQFRTAETRWTYAGNKATGKYDEWKVEKVNDDGTLTIRKKRARKPMLARINDAGLVEVKAPYGWSAENKPEPLGKKEKIKPKTFEHGAGEHELYKVGKARLDEVEALYDKHGIKGPKATKLLNKLREEVAAASKLEAGADVGSDWSGPRARLSSATRALREYLGDRARSMTSEKRKAAQQAAAEKEREGVKPASAGVGDLETREAPPDVKADENASAIWEHIKNRRIVDSYTIPDYPIGRGYRGQLKVWVEHKPAKGWRVMTQTTDRSGRWNKPKGSTYSTHPTYVIEPQGDERGVLLSVGGWSYGNAKSISVTQVRGQSVMSYEPGDEGSATIGKIVDFAKQRRAAADVEAANKAELVKQNEEKLARDVEKAKQSYIRNAQELAAREDQIALVANPDSLKTQARKSYETAKRLVEQELPRKQRQIEAFLKRHGHEIPADEPRKPAATGPDRYAELKRQQDVKPAVRLSPHQRRMGQFMTPHQEAYRIAELANVAGKTVLDPTAGEGRFMKYARELGAADVKGVEIDPGLAEYSGATHADFLSAPVEGLQADVLLMNPPFTTGGPDTAAIVDKAINQHWTGKGKAALILPAGPSGEKIISKYRGMVEREEALPDDAFKREGTQVRSKLYILRKG